MSENHNAWSQDQEIKFLKKHSVTNYLGETRSREETKQWLQGYIEGCKKRKNWEVFQNGRMLMKMSERFITDYAQQMLRQL